MDLSESDIRQKKEERWQPFINFKRIVDNQLLMSSPDRVVKDVLPGIVNV